MNIDFAFILVLLVAVSGVIWLFDAIYLAPRRRLRLATLGPEPDDSVIEEVERPSVVVDYARSFFPVFLIVLLLRSFLVEPFRIPSASMMPTLLIGDFILVNKYYYGIRLPVANTKILDVGAPERGDVVVFRYPKDPSTPYIKRVVGVPGDRIVYDRKILYINDKPIPQEDLSVFHGVGAGRMMTGALVRGEDLGGVDHDILVMPGQPSRDQSRIVVPDGHYFVLGDNRDNSKDSRFWGLVPDENLIGKAFMIWMNWDGENRGVAWNRIGEKIR